MKIKADIHKRLCGAEALINSFYSEDNIIALSFTHTLTSLQIDAENAVSFFSSAFMTS